MDEITALVVPYRKKLGQTQYLLHKELIDKWDQRMDRCGICITGDLETIEKDILAVLEKEHGYIGDLNEMNSLGVCAGDRSTSNTYYLYAIDLSKAKISDPKLQENAEKHFWASDQVLLESIDAQMITCYAKIQYLLM